jgi:pyruvate/2-oxoglutarate/acetoin dehydrogenase E1 component
MAETTYVKAINGAMAKAMRSDERVPNLRDKEET